MQATEMSDDTEIEIDSLTPEQEEGIRTAFAHGRYGCIFQSEKEPGTVWKLEQKNIPDWGYPEEAIMTALQKKRSIPNNIVFSTIREGRLRDVIVGEDEDDDYDGLFIVGDKTDEIFNTPQGKFQKGTMGCAKLMNANDADGGPYDIQVSTMFKYDGDLLAPPPNCKLSDVAQQLDEGLRELKRVGVVHRDIKPENVFWREVKDAEGVLIGYEYALGDLGLSDFTDEDHNHPDYVRDTTLAGTDAYYDPSCLKEYKMILTDAIHKARLELLEYDNFEGDDLGSTQKNRIDRIINDLAEETNPGNLDSEAHSKLKAMKKKVDVYPEIAEKLNRKLANPYSEENDEEIEDYRGKLKRATINRTEIETIRSILKPKTRSSFNSDRFALGATLLEVWAIQNNWERKRPDTTTRGPPRLELEAGESNTKDKGSVYLSPDMLRRTIETWSTFFQSTKTEIPVEFGMKKGLKMNRADKSLIWMYYQVQNGGGNDQLKEILQDDWERSLLMGDWSQILAFVVTMTDLEPDEISAFTDMNPAKLSEDDINALQDYVFGKKAVVDEVEEREEEAAEDSYTQAVNEFSDFLYGHIESIPSEIRTRGEYFELSYNKKKWSERSPRDPTVPELKAIISDANHQELGLRTTGSKQALIDRLNTAVPNWKPEFDLTRPESLYVLQSKLDDDRYQQYTEEDAAMRLKIEKTKYINDRARVDDKNPQKNLKINEMPKDENGAYRYVPLTAIIKANISKELVEEFKKRQNEMNAAFNKAFGKETTKRLAEWAEKEKHDKEDEKNWQVTDRKSLKALEKLGREAGATYNDTVVQAEETWRKATDKNAIEKTLTNLYTKHLIEHTEFFESQASTEFTDFQDYLVKKLEENLATESHMDKIVRLAVSLITNSEEPPDNFTIGEKDPFKEAEAALKLYNEFERKGSDISVTDAYITLEKSIDAKNINIDAMKTIFSRSELTEAKIKVENPQGKLLKAALMKKRKTLENQTLQEFVDAARDFERNYVVDGGKEIEDGQISFVRLQTLVDQLNRDVEEVLRFLYRKQTGVTLPLLNASVYSDQVDALSDSETKPFTLSMLPSYTKELPIIHRAHTEIDMPSNEKYNAVCQALQDADDKGKTLDLSNTAAIEFLGQSTVGRLSESSNDNIRIAVQSKQTEIINKHNKKMAEWLKMAAKSYCRRFTAAQEKVTATIQKVVDHQYIDLNYYTTFVIDVAEDKLCPGLDVKMNGRDLYLFDVSPSGINECTIIVSTDKQTTFYTKPEIGSEISFICPKDAAEALLVYPMLQIPTEFGLEMIESDPKLDEKEVKLDGHGSEEFKIARDDYRNDQAFMQRLGTLGRISEEGREYAFEYSQQVQKQEKTLYESREDSTKAVDPEWKLRQLYALEAVDYDDKYYLLKLPATEVKAVSATGAEDDGGEDDDDDDDTQGDEEEDSGAEETDAETEGEEDTDDDDDEDVEADVEDFLEEKLGKRNDVDYGEAAKQLEAKLVVLAKAAEDVTTDPAIVKIHKKLKKIYADYVNEDVEAHVEDFLEEELRKRDDVDYGEAANELEAKLLARAKAGEDVTTDPAPAIVKIHNELRKIYANYVDEEASVSELLEDLGKVKGLDYGADAARLEDEFSREQTDAVAEQLQSIYESKVEESHVPDFNKQADEIGNELENFFTTQDLLTTEVKSYLGAKEESVKTLASSIDPYIGAEPWRCHKIRFFKTYFDWGGYEFDMKSDTWWLKGRASQKTLNGRGKPINDLSDEEFLEVIETLLRVETVPDKKDMETVIDFVRTLWLFQRALRSRKSYLFPSDYAAELAKKGVHSWTQTRLDFIEAFLKKITATFTKAQKGWAKYHKLLGYHPYSRPKKPAIDPIRDLNAGVFANVMKAILFPSIFCAAEFGFTTKKIYGTDVKVGERYPFEIYSRRTASKNANVVIELLLRPQTSDRTGL